MDGANARAEPGDDHADATASSTPAVRDALNGGSRREVLGPPVPPRDLDSEPISTGTSSSVHVVDPPIPRSGVVPVLAADDVTGMDVGPDDDRHLATVARRPTESRAVFVLAATAVVVAAAGAAVAAAVGILAVRQDMPILRLVAIEAVVVVVASASAVGVLVALRSRLRRRLDEPLAALSDAVSALQRGDLDARTGRRGDADLDVVARGLDAATASVQSHVRRLRQHAEWGAQSRMIFEALDLADHEADAHRVAEQALAIIAPDRAIELLLAPHGSTELTLVATNPGRPAPGCPVDEIGGCVAIRRAQPVVFDSSESINACPKLRGRPYGPCAGSCVPVSIAGRPVGVLHTVSRDRHPPDERFVGQLATLATQLGNRLGALRALESSRLEASTDKLTGLPNRRLLESQLATLIDRSTPFVLVLADLDNFKNLNDSYGHEIGDRALQLFAQVLRDKVRGNDVIARLGGEEFVLVYPNMTVTTSIEAVERVRDGLTRALAVSSLPEFTCSFGITHSSVGRSAEAILRVADAGLLRAKELGRDQVVYADETLAARVFGDDDTRR